MKLVNYRCENCEKNVEELFDNHEEQPEELEEKCECGGTVKKFNYKNNCQVWRYLS